MVDFEMVFWKGIKGASSGGTSLLLLLPLEKSDPPSAPRLGAPERDRSTSGYVYQHLYWQGFLLLGGDHTFNALLNLILCLRTEDLTLSPNLNHTAELILNVGGGASVRDACGLCDDLLTIRSIARFRGVIWRVMD
jgi:hypothetical protein